MIRGQYAAGTGMMVQRRRMEVVTNNIVNVETTGYKREMLVSQSFDDVMLRRINDSVDERALGPYNFGVQSDQIYYNFEEGNFEETGRPTDLAIAGDAFFTVQTPAGDRYTSASSYVVDPDGYLTNPDGYYLLGENGLLLVGQGNFTVTESGEVYQADGTYVDKLRLVAFEDNKVLLKQGDSLFSAPEGSAMEAQSFTLKQGFLENSNVEVSREMVDMITLYRSYEANQRILTMLDEIVGKAVNEIGGLR